MEPLRSAAARKFSEFGFPSTKDEEFKYLDLRYLADEKFHYPYGANLSRSQLEQLPLGATEAITLTFINGQYAPEFSSAEHHKGAAFVATFEDAEERYGEKIAQWIGKPSSYAGKLGSTNDSRFTDLNTMFLGEGAVVIIPKGKTEENLIHLQFVTAIDRQHGPLSVHPRVLVILEENSEAKILETFTGEPGKYLVNPVTEIVLGESARLEHIRVQIDSPEATHVGTLAVWQEANSTYTTVGANFGAWRGRADINVWLNGEHTETWLNGVNVALGSQVLDNHTRIDHAKPNCNSFEVYKTIVGDEAGGVFNGKIFVYEDAQKTDAKQTNQAILLSPTARMDSKPQLEIFADDVKCTHGATVGQLSKDELFYLRSRGIGETRARAILIYAFAAEVLEMISSDSVKKTLENYLFKLLAGEEID